MRRLEHACERLRISVIDSQAARALQGLTFRRYRILGACNPPFAHKALTEETDTRRDDALQRVVYEGNDGLTHIDPGKTMGVLGKPKLAELGRQVAASRRSRWRWPPEPPPS